MTAIKTMVESGVLDLSKPNVRRYIVQKLGIEDINAKIAKMRQAGSNEEEAYKKILCGQLGIQPTKIEAFKPKENEDPKKIINENELEHYLTDGWDIQTILPSGKILIKK